MLIGMGAKAVFLPPVTPGRSGRAERTRDKTSLFLLLAIVDCLSPFFLSSSSLTAVAFLAFFLFWSTR